MRLGFEPNPPLEGVATSSVTRRDLFVSIVIFVVAFWSQRWVLELPLTAIDTMPTLVAARAQSAWEFLEVLTRELRGDATTGGYYRPLTLVTYTIDQWIWGGTPWGYHLTDVAVHALACVAVYWMARLAVDLPLIPSLLAAVVLLLHPVVIEVVPAIARREEALIVVGFCLAVIGARAVPLRIGWLLVLLGSVIAVTAAERGLAVPGVVAAHLLFYRFASERFGRRIVETVRWTLPSVGVAGAFFWLRAVLHGGGGIDPSPLGFFTIPLNFAMLLLYPQQMVDVVAPHGLAQTVAFLAIAGVVGLVLLGPILRARRSRVILFALGWVACYVALISIAGILFAWYVYPAAPALGLVAAFYATRISSLRSGPTLARIGGGLAAAAVVLVLVPILVPSPVFREYPAWRVGSAMSEQFLDELTAIGRDAAPGESIVVFNLPAHYSEAQSDYMVTRSAAILWPSSVEVWRQDHLPEVNVTVIGCSNFVGGPSIPEIEFTEETVRVYFVEGHSTYTNAYRDWPAARKLPEEIGRGYEFPWPSAVRMQFPMRMFVFDGERLIPFSG